MASVYLADDIVLGESTVAVKVLRRDRTMRDDLIQRFLREVRLTHKINHENVVRTFDFGQEGDTLYYTMEYLPGATLEAMLREPHLPIPKVLSIATQLMRGLAAIHAVGVVHRDLKPANIIMRDGGKLKIADFGIARGGSSALTVDSGEIVGTITYVAPETLIGEDSTSAVDYYALGAILYQLLTQHAPIDDEVPARLLLRKVEEAPRDPRDYRDDIPDWLARGLMGLLEVDPLVRMKALSQFASNLDTYAPKSSSDSLVSTLVPETLTIDKVLVDKPLRTRFLSRSKRGTLLTKTMLSVLVGLLALPLSLTETASKLEMQHFDSLFQLRGEKTPRSDVVLISIDEQSYTNLAVPLTAPWPRELHTKLLTKLKEYSPKRVVFDVLFVGSSQDPKIDGALANAMHQVPTVLGAATGLSQQATLNGSYMLEQLIKPGEEFVANSTAIGNVGLPTDLGRVRNVLVERSEMFPDLPSLAEAASGIGKEDVRPNSRALLNYYGPARTMPTVQYYMALSDESPLPPEVFKDKIVFVGLNLRSRTGPSQREAFVTPFDAATYGTEIHATATSNLLSKDWISRLPVRGEVVLSALLAATFSLVLLAASGYLLLVYLTGTVLLLLAAQYLAFLLGWAIPVVTPLVFGLFCGLLFRILLGNSSAGAKWRV
jgi:serine/threonine protein kinase